ncbi:MAG: synthase subunit [Actinomycetota bacterium]|jgi:F-type H+-transporting ATPase subunit a
MLGMSTFLPLSGAEGEGGFHAPSTEEFFPGGLLFVGTPFEMSRINLIMVFMTFVIVFFFVSAFARAKFVPSKLQNIGEVALDFVRINIAEEVMGHEGRKYTPYFATIFFMLLGFNITGIIPPLQIAATSVIAVPLILAAVSWLVFNVQGIRAHGVVEYLKMNLFPAGVPKPIYLLVTPIEAVSTFLLRPMTLTVRLLANMVAGHLLLVLFFSATSALLIDGQGVLKVFGLASYAMGFSFTLFEVLVAFLQAYIFTLLTAVYISGATAEEH